MMTTVALLLALITSSPGAEAAGEPVLLDFHSDRCPPCRQMRPAIQQLIQKGYRVKSVDADESPELCERYQVENVPTFIVVDPSGRAMARTQGVQPARQLADLYRNAKAKIAEPPAVDDSSAGAKLTSAEADAEGDARSENRPDDEAVNGAKAVASKFANPKPWETVVRIKVHDASAIGLGSGTVIHSTPQESIIMTCAHIFKLQGGRPPKQASQFPRKITVDLFDGRLSGPEQMVHKVETVAAEALDYDFDLDVGLIRIRPGRRLPASRVVPASWRPEVRMPMITVGCSEGHDATTWETTISQPSVRLVRPANYEAIACKRAPKQGRSGGGLYTPDGYLAGVCDFAEPRGNHGLYASPRSIHNLLDRNRLTALYAPASSRPGTLLAQGRAPTMRASTPTLARAQSPDRDESSPVTIPPPDLLGIPSPAIARDRAGRTAWQSRPATPPTVAPDAQMAEMNLAPAADSDHFASMNDLPAPSTSDSSATPDARSAPPVGASKVSKWQRVTASGVGRAAE